MSGQDVVVQTLRTGIAHGQRSPANSRSEPVAQIMLDWSILVERMPTRPLQARADRTLGRLER